MLSRVDYEQAARRGDVDREQGAGGIAVETVGRSSLYLYLES